MNEKQFQDFIMFQFDIIKRELVTIRENQYNKLKVLAVQNVRNEVIEILQIESIQEYPDGCIIKVR